MLFYAPRMQSVLTPLFFAILVAISSATQSSALAVPMDASVKLRVDSHNGHDWGTGTIIDSRQGPEGQEALILTCGHLFRTWGPHFSEELHKQRNFEVHLYGENSSTIVYGRCLYYDLEVDLALVIIAPPSPVQAVPIAPAGYQIQPGQQAWSIGCDNGSNPTVQTHQIMSVDRFFKARDNRALFHFIQVSGAPVSGRSGGGLFSAEGYLIGVCNTGDPAVNDGHFVPPHVIRHILDTMGLTFVYQNTSLVEPVPQTPSPTALVAVTPLTPLAPIESVATAPISTVPPVAMVSTPASIFANNQSNMNQIEQATLEEVTRRKQDGDEVIVIINSRNPGTRSDVIRLNGTSSQFLDALVNPPAQLAPTADRQPASFSVRH